MDTTDTDDDTAVEDTDVEVVGDAKVRVVHLSPDAPGVDLYVNGETAGVDGVTFQLALVISLCPLLNTPLRLPLQERP